MPSQTLFGVGLDMITFAPLATMALAALVRYVTYVCTIAPLAPTQVSVPDPKQAERRLSFVGEREPPSLCPNSMIT